MSARICPHCGVFSKFTQQSGGTGIWGSDKIPVQLNSETCDHCSGIIAIVITRGNSPKEIHSFPVSLPTADGSVFKPATDDYVEGVKCLGVTSYKAAATMFRRAVQQVMIDKKAAGSRLMDQIDDLKAKGVISSDLAEWAHEIRLWGNIGAHPSDDGLNEVTIDDVVIAQTFLESLFEYCYVLPASVASSRAKRAKQIPPNP